jgi:hypothetical protein
MRIKGVNNMKIYPKRTFRFDHPSSSPDIVPVYVRNEEFSNVPDWVADSSMFKLAIEADLIMVIENKNDEIAAETDKASRRKTEEQVVKQYTRTKQSF